MAARKAPVPLAAPPEASGTRPRLALLSIKNFRCIGQNPVVVELDDIVVLVGPNNAGKSSVLKAYEVVMSEGAKEGELTLEDFPERTVTLSALPEIELTTVVYDNSPGEQWIATNSAGERFVRERWTWEAPGKPVRRGFLVKENRWAADSDSEKVPWGAPNVANARRPQPHRIDAFASPADQAQEIVALLVKALTERVKAFKKDSGGGGDTAFKKLLDSIAQAQKQLVSEASTTIAAVEKELSDQLAKVFPGHAVKFDARAEDDLEKSVNFFKADAQLLVGPADGFKSMIENQGSGARRTLLWTAIKLLAESSPAGATASRPHVLLLDEPEICLHPAAIREACDALYGLAAATSNWQVVVTTHSPCFVDFSRDHTSVVRVERTAEGVVQGTTIFRPATASFTGSDKELLKLLNMCDPYVAEFFFGGRTVLVEGDTEYVALKFVQSLDPASYGAVHIVRARGKATLVALAKILNQFKAPYSVLHDSDLPTYRKNGAEAANPAWTQNENIRVEVGRATVRTRRVASVPHFERAYLGSDAQSEKPYTALTVLHQNGEARARVAQLLKALVDFDQALPEGAIEWENLEGLKAKVAASVR